MSIQRRWYVWAIAGACLLAVMGGVLTLSGVLDGGPAVSISELKIIDATNGAIGGWMYLAYSADGKILSASIINRIVEYNAETGAPLRTLESMQNTEFDYQVFLGGGKQMAIIQQPGLLIYDTQTGKEMRTMAFGAPVIFDYNRFAVSPDEKLVAVPYFENPNESMAQGVVLMDATSGKESRRLDQHTSPITQVSFSKDGQQLLTSSNDGSVVVWDVSSGKPLRTLKGHSLPVRDADFSKDGTRVIECSADGTTLEWDINTGKPLLTLQSVDTTMATSVAYSGDESLIVVGRSDGTVQIWSRRTGRLLKTVSGENSPVMDVAFAPDGTSLAFSQWSGKITLLTVEVN